MIEAFCALDWVPTRVNTSQFVLSAGSVSRYDSNYSTTNFITWLREFKYMITFFRFDSLVSRYDLIVFCTELYHNGVYNTLILTFLFTMFTGEDHQCWI